MDCVGDKPVKTKVINQTFNKFATVETNDTSRKFERINAEYVSRVSVLVMAVVVPYLAIVCI